jgi:DNA-directed RNA polymerase sigma subunit (sigma70/sigma32)
VKKELDLTPVQVEQMETILDDFAKYYTTVLSDGKSRILQILNDDQKKKFEKMLAEGSAGH